MPALNQEQYRPQMHAALAEISALVFDAPGFREASFRFRDPIGPDANAELSIRPVTVGGDPLWQLTRAGLSENKGHGRAKKLLWDLANSANILLEAHASSEDGAALHLRTTKKGHVLLQRVRGKTNAECRMMNAECNRVPSIQHSAFSIQHSPDERSPHDREKDYPLARFDSAKLLLALGFTTADGAMKPSMHAKYRQVNQFLSILDATLDELPPRKDPKAPLVLVDCGCGKAYLSFGAKAYLEATRGVPVRLEGVNRNEKVVAFCRRTAEALGCAETATFAACDIAKFKPSAAPDVVLSLHACDTATDEALAFGVERGARAIVSAPCCQHELQKTLDANLRPHRAVLRNGILRERLADILTDAFRAQILRVMGYRASVVEFVDPEATARNVLIRAVRVSRPGTGTALADYEDLRSAWGVTPWLATRLAALRPELASPADPGGASRAAGPAGR